MVRRVMTSVDARLAERNIEFASQLDEWFRAQARPLPWRAPGTTPWAVLLSEIMSQQTQVARVIPKWQEFLERWPTPADLAAASDAEVIRAWDRLGYPRRAVRLRALAEAIRDRHAGEVPDTVEELLALPGIGPYTAGAVAAFAFGVPAQVVDTNVRRVVARHRFGHAEAWAPSVARDTAAWNEVTQAVPAPLVVSLAQNSMELGALVCTARTPACERCPIAEQCAWRAEGYPAADDSLPKRKPQARYAGSLREMRGMLLAELREHAEHSEAELRAMHTTAGTEDPRFETALESLITDGLVVRSSKGSLQLP